MALSLGIDTGGTFTDFLLYDDTTKSIRIHKVLSTPTDPEQAILQGISDLCIDTDRLFLVHGSTVATNAIIEGKGIRTAYITNTGFADVLSIGRQARKELYNLTPEKKPPLIEPELCLEVNTRLSAQGEHLHKLTEINLSTLKQQIEDLDPEAVAINLLFSFIDDSEELKIEQVIPKNIFISRSSDVLPEYGEFERGITTTLNAKVGPLMQGYLTRLKTSVPGCNLSVMQSSGGTTSVEQAGRYPVNLLLSGPAGGLKGALTVARASGVDRLLSFDMGGTSTDVSIVDKCIGFTNDTNIGGYPVAVPAVDLHSIGAGGGSIARVDAGRLLLVGPESAGADPGPACYGKKGTLATVTDANVVLGRLLPQSFLGGNMSLDVPAADVVIKNVADQLNINIHQAAQGIVDVVNNHMVNALRVMSVQRGKKPKDYTLVSFGGAGGLHVCALAEELQMTKALIPVNAGVLSALGLLAADATRQRSRSTNTIIKDCNSKEIDTLFLDLVEQAKSELLYGSTDAPGNNEETQQSFAIRIDSTVDVRYRGQSHALNLPWQGLQKIEQTFHKLHEDTYGHQLEIDIELVTLRVLVFLEKPAFELPVWKPTESHQKEFTTVLGIKEPVPVFNRMGLTVGQKLMGPALITEITSTTWLANRWSADVDHFGNLVLINEGV